MPGTNTNVPSYFNWNYTMPSLGPNGELTGSPIPFDPNNYHPELGVDILNSDGTYSHMDAHKDRNGNWENPTTFMSDSLPGGVAYAYPDTDEYAHIGRVFRTDRNRAIGQILALVGGGALAANLGAGATATGAGENFGSGFASASDAAFGSVAPEVGTGVTGALAPAAADVMTVTAPALAGGIGAGTAAGIGGGALTAASLAGATGGGEGADALMGDEGMTVPEQPPSGGFFSNIGKGITNSLTNPDGSYNWQNILKLGGGAASVLGGLVGGKGGNTQTEPTMPAGWNDPAQYQSMSRQRTAPITDYNTYGQTGGEHKFFTDPVYSPRGATSMVNGPIESPPDKHIPNLSMEPIAKRAGGGNVRGPGSGREDKIDALLSDGEYVMDAESVALLGDGSVDEGSRRLDQLRQNIRKHKGSALAKGKFSPNAKRPEEYMGMPHKAKGGRISKMIDTFLHSNIPPVPQRRAPYTPEELQHLADWLRANSPDSDVLKHFDTPMTPDLRGRVPTPQDLAAHGELLDSIQSQPPVQRAKGGMTLLQGGKGQLDPALRIEQLANAQRTAAAVRAQKGDLTPPSPAIQGDRSIVEAARQRLKLIRSLADTTPSPVMKAEGGSVKALTQFADRLQDEHVDEPELIETP